jgi:nicotinate-nucleotide adenylyltransferase
MAATTIGVYGGTFDPPHIGHLAVAEEVREAVGLELVLFVPCAQQPLKSDGPHASGEQRLRMLQTSVAGNPGFAVSDIELRQEGPSYTIDTLDTLRSQHPDVEWRFILGTDAANSLASWRAPRRILAEYRPIVLARAGWAALNWAALERVHPDARALVRLIDVPHLAISSTDLRRRIAAGRSVRYLIPDGARLIIEEEGLYGAR